MLFLSVLCGEQLRMPMRLKKRLRNLVCKRYCIFFKPGVKDDLACQGLLFLEKSLERELLSWELLSSLYHPLPSLQEYPFDSILKKELCQLCPFLPDGCDFRHRTISTNAPPCGGYLILQNLIQVGFLDPLLFVLIRLTR